MVYKSTYKYIGKILRGRTKLRQKKTQKKLSKGFEQ